MALKTTMMILHNKAKWKALGVVNGNANEDMSKTTAGGSDFFNGQYNTISTILNM